MRSERRPVVGWSLVSFVVGVVVALVMVKAPRRPVKREPAGGTIKGHKASMLYHPPSSPYYARVQAQEWFRTPEQAEAAGFTAWNKRRPGAR